MELLVLAAALLYLGNWLWLKWKAHRVMRWQEVVENAKLASRMLNTTPGLRRLHCASCGNPLTMCPDNCDGRR